MDNLFEIGELGIVRDIPAELTQLKSSNNVLRAQLQRQTNICGILKLCLIGAVIYIIVKYSLSKPKEK